MRDYGKVHASFWSSDTIRSLSEDGRMLALYLMTSPHTTITGTFRLPDGYACEDLSWSAERVIKGFAELLSNGFANRCETTKWVWICKHLEWNPPENPNQRKSAVKMALSVPESCGWKAAFLSHCGPLIGIESANPCETPSQPFANQEQEQEQKQEKKKTLSAGADDAESKSDGEKGGAPKVLIPAKAILAAYHEHLPMLPAVRLLTDERKRKLKARWLELPERQAVDYWDKFFAYAAKSDFLTGRDNRWTSCDFEWLIEKANHLKVSEGKYENRSDAA